MNFDLPWELIEVRELCAIHNAQHHAEHELFILSNVEDWLQRNDITYDSERKTVNDGFFSQTFLMLKIPNDIQALQFKLSWL